MLSIIMWQTIPKFSGAALWLGNLGSPSAGLSWDHSCSCGHLVAQWGWKAQGIVDGSLLEKEKLSIPGNSPGL